jgi:NitT/TauT family transport system substrate-binding protein
MNNFRLISFVCGAVLYAISFDGLAKEKIHALYIPLADHYPGLVAHHKYSDSMTEADYSVEMMKSWPSLKGKFLSGQADVAFIVSPLAMNMYAESPTFKWVSLIHRDGSALAVNDKFLESVNLSESRADRKPHADFANAASSWKRETGKGSVSGVPSLEATHTLVLYKYLKDHGKVLSLGRGDGDVVAKSVAPPKSPAFIQGQDERGVAASFEQSLPWADVVETGGFGKVVWYSKDVLQWPNGHVECIIIASNDAIKNKSAALKEVISAIHKAGIDIDVAMSEGGQKLDAIASIIHENYIDLHSPSAIKSSLNSELGVINYVNLNNDEKGLDLIMGLALESGVMKKEIDIDQFSDNSFSTKITEK